jgi:hypothetical protein
MYVWAMKMSPESEVKGENIFKRKNKIIFYSKPPQINYIK